MAAATILTPVTMKSPFVASYAATDADFAFAASTATDGDRYLITGKEILLLQNTTGGALTVTITSQVDEKNRTGNITAYSVGAGLFSAFAIGLTNAKGWKNSSSYITLVCSGTGLKVAVLRIPDGFPS